jgi:hypothetical protein
MFYVYGDYGYESQCELYSDGSRAAAEQWAIGYTRNGTGGYDQIEVAYFASNGEYVTVWRCDAEDPEFAGGFDDSWNDDNALEHEF